MWSYDSREVVQATVKRTLLADEVDQVDQYDDLYEGGQTELSDRAFDQGANGIDNYVLNRK